MSFLHPVASLYPRKRLSTFTALLFLAAILSLGLPPQPSRAQGVNVLTSHNDNARTGQNLSETALTPASVNPTGFGRLFSQPVDGYVYAQPLYMAGLTVNGAKHNVVFVATEHDSVYAFDADSNAGANASSLWQRSFLDPANGVTAIPNGDTGTDDIHPEVGITGTPVIDAGTNTLYVVAKTKENGSYVQRLHALDVTTGLDRTGSPVLIQASVKGTGDGTDGNGNVAFDPLREHQRPGLVLSNGVVYIAWASHGDNRPYHGWLIGYGAIGGAKSMTQVAVYNTDPNGGLSGIWMSGSAPAADASGNLFFMTGNGTFDANLPGGLDYGDSFVKLGTQAGLSVLDYFTPYNQDSLSAADADLGSGGLLLLPDAVGSTAHPHLLVGCGKQGVIYLVDRDTGKMGEFTPGTDNVVQEIGSSGTWSMPAFWNNSLYYQGAGDVLKQFAFSFTNGVSNGTLMSSPVSSSATGFGFPGATPSISANGSTGGIAWVVRTDAYDGNGPAELHAYDATNLANELYNTTMVAARDTPGPAVKFAVPTVTGGKVYVGTQTQLSVYGLNPPPIVAMPTISPNGGFVGDQVTLADTTSGAALYYTTDGSTPTQSSTPYTGAFTVSNPGTIHVQAFKAGFLDSGVASAFFGRHGTPGSGDGLNAQYFSNQNLTAPAAITRVDPTVNYPSWPNNSPGAGVGPNNWSARWTGWVQPEFTDTYTFSVTSDDGARLWVNGQLVVDAWYDQGPTEHSGTIALTAGQHYDIKLEYYQDGGGTACTLSWSSPSFLEQIIPQTQLYSQPQAAAPTITPDGGAFTGPVSVTLADATAGAVIHYTTDGTAPTLASPAYGGPLTLTRGATVSAIAAGGGYAASAPASAVFTVQQPAATPTISPNGGTFINSVLVTLADTTPGATLHYTTDGSAPTVTSSAYTGPFTLNASAMVAVIAVASGYAASAPNSAAFTIQSQVAAIPTISPQGGTFTNSVLVTLTDTTPNATLYYTTDRTTPTSSSQAYAGPFMLNASATVTVIAVASGYVDSAPASAAFNIQRTAATPSINPNGGAFTKPITVTLSDTTPGATLYYTTNHLTPTLSSQVYKGPFTLTHGQTVIAIAAANGYLNSLPATATFTIGPQTAVPTITPDGGAFTGPVSVTLADATAGAVIHYTTDGTAPTLASPAYGGPLTLTRGATVSAIAAGGGYAASAPASAVFTLTNGSALAPVADAYVRDGWYVFSNFGSQPQLIVKKVSSDSYSSYNRVSYLKFDLSGVTRAPTSAKLTLTVNADSNPATDAEDVQLYAVSGTAWSEHGITWANAPGLNWWRFTSEGTLLTTVHVPLQPGTATFDLTAFVRAHLGKVVTLQLMDASTQNVYLAFNSKEAASGRPALTLAY